MSFQLALEVHVMVPPATSRKMWSSHVLNWIGDVVQVVHPRASAMNHLGVKVKASSFWSRVAQPVMHKVVHAGSWGHSFTSKHHDVVDVVDVCVGVGWDAQMLHAQVGRDVDDLLMHLVEAVEVPPVLVHTVSRLKQCMQLRP